MTARKDGRRVYFHPSVEIASYAGTCRLAGRPHYARMQARAHTVTWPIMYADGIHIQTSRGRATLGLFAVDTYTQSDAGSACRCARAARARGKTFIYTKLFARYSPLVYNFKLCLPLKFTYRNHASRPRAKNRRNFRKVAWKLTR